MIICDQCHYPAGDNAEVKPVAKRCDPYGEEHWCGECQTAYDKFHTEARLRVLNLIAEEITNKMKVYLKGKRRNEQI